VTLGSGQNGLSREAGSLKIATFNINNINKRLHNLTAWLARAQPDVVCLQELKVEQRAFSASALCDVGYRGVWLGERSWNGVAILARERDALLTRSSLPGNLKDHQARYIEAAVNGVLIASIYLPNGNPQPGPKFDYKMAWFECLIEHGAELMKAGVPVVGEFRKYPEFFSLIPQSMRHFSPSPANITKLLLCAGGGGFLHIFVAGESEHDTVPV
jgi:exodeoxyribonuclease-3